MSKKKTHKIKIYMIYNKLWEKKEKKKKNREKEIHSVIILQISIIK